MNISVKISDFNIALQSRGLKVTVPSFYEFSKNILTGSIK